MTFKASMSWVTDQQSSFKPVFKLLQQHTVVVRQLWSIVPSQTESLRHKQTWDQHMQNLSIHNCAGSMTSRTDLC